MTELKAFFYGTLKTGGRFDRRYDHVFGPNRIKCSKAKVKGTLFNLGWFPGVRLGGDKEVHGELHVFKNPEKIIPLVDSIEGYNERNPEGSLYLRKEVEVELEDGTKETAFVYEFNRSLDGAEEVESGVWDINS